MLVMTFVTRDHLFDPDDDVKRWHTWPPGCAWKADVQPDGVPLATMARARLAQMAGQCVLPDQELWVLAAWATAVEHTFIEDPDPDRHAPHERRMGLVLHLTDMVAHTFFDLVERSQGQRKTLTALGDGGLAKWMLWLANELDGEMRDGR